MGARFAELMGTSLPSAFVARPLTPIRPEVRRILFVGRLAEEKNIPKVIEVARARPELQVSIAGDGPLKQLVADAAADTPNIDYLGWVARSEIIDVVDDHDLMLLPSQVESFGTVALEAMARGRLVLVSDACGITEWPQLVPGLFTIGPNESVAAAVDRVAGLPFAERQDKAAWAHRAARELHETNVQDWIDWLLSNGRAYAETD
jgi:glycosyltransferase involved in cell wall biosynthesis